MSAPTSGPNGLSAEQVFHKQIAVTWEHSHICTPEPSSYNIYRIDGAENDGSKVLKDGALVGSTTEFLFVETFPWDRAKIYSYAMTAVNHNGESEPTDGVAIVV